LSVPTRSRAEAQANGSDGNALVNELQRFLRGFLEVERLLPLMHALHLVLRAILHNRAA
jgi:hypothetical protein